ncbi:MAG TPA: flagellar motor switch protein FliM [Firmicutes bacterium]|nr:flagellar motor switch protein FliM [Bacillota bacterium]
MPDVLSQDEIDALLSALSTGEVKAEDMQKEENRRRVKVYDFRRPDKFSKDQLRTIELMHENYARLLSTSLATYLRTIVDVHLISVQQMTYAEFVQSLPSPTIISVFQLKPLGGAILEMNSELGLMMVERLLGGKMRLPDKSRELTDIEQTILRRIVYRCLSHLKEAWQNVAEVEATFERMELNPQFVQIVAPNQMVVLVTLSVKGDDNEGFMNICLPDTLLEPVVSKLTAHYWLASARQGVTAETLEALRRRVEQTVVEAVVVLGETPLTVGEILDLQRGDVIALGTKADGLLDLRVGNRVKFRVRPGVVGSKLAVEIAAVVREGDGE